MKKHVPIERNTQWPERPKVFPNLMTPTEAAMFLRLDQTGHSPDSACRTLDYWRDTGQLRATKYAWQAWCLKDELENSGLVIYESSIVIRKTRNLS